eukprot:8437764-Pyramimonas_sp.AAC.1
MLLPGSASAEPVLLLGRGGAGVGDHGALGDGDGATSFSDRFFGEFDALGGSSAGAPALEDAA